jgi:S1-C subfamily serine protease
LLLALLLGSGCAADLPPQAMPAAPPPAEVAKAAEASFLALETGTGADARIIGSAVAVGSSLLATNRHVLEAAGGRPIIAVRPDGRRLPAAEVMRSTTADLAFLRVPVADLVPVPLDGESRGLWAIGAQDGATHVLPAVLLRSSTRVAPFGDGFIVRMPHAARGFSGGPALDRRGRLAGLTTAGCAIRRPEDGPVLARLAAGLPGPSPACLSTVFVLNAGTVRAELARIADPLPVDA